nr:hypothetical protein [Tanacetum cinerariifolium]
ELLIIRCAKMLVKQRLLALAVQKLRRRLQVALYMSVSIKSIRVMESQLKTMSNCNSHGGSYCTFLTLLYFSR